MRSKNLAKFNFKLILKMVEKKVSNFGHEFAKINLHVMIFVVSNLRLFFGQKFADQNTSARTLL